jgi:hypothetical protein
VNRAAAIAPIADIGGASNFHVIGSQFPCSPEIIPRYFSPEISLESSMDWALSFGSI